MKRQVIVDRTNPNHNIFSRAGSGFLSEHVQTYEEALVEDVIVNDEHTSYSTDGYNVGAIKFRRINSDQYKDSANLNWAFPLDSNITDYPLLGEIVIIISLLNRFYYSRKINISSGVTSHAFPDLQKELQPVVDKSQDYTKHKINKVNDKSSLGKYFQDKGKIFRLKNFEGDIIYEGRSGQSIRFGSAFKNNQIFQSTGDDQCPNILMRVGPIDGQKKSVDSPYGLVIEDINNDASSIWMTSNQTILLKPSTHDNKIIHRKSVSDYPTSFDKNQIAITSDRIILNSKSEKILASSGRGIHFETLKNFTVDSENDYFSFVGRDRKIDIQQDNLQNILRNMSFWIGKDLTIDVSGIGKISSSNLIEIRSSNRMSLISKKIYIGSQSNSSQPIILGTELTNILLELLRAQVAAAVGYTLTMTGPTFLNPSVISAMNKAIAALSSKKHLSDDNFVNKKNDSPGNINPYKSLH